MALRASLTSIFVLAALATSSAQAAPIIGSFQIQYPALFAPTDGGDLPVLVRAFTEFGAPVPSGAEVRIGVTCGQFVDGSTSIVALVGDHGWVSDQGTWRSPSQEQDCSMTFTEDGGSASLTLPVHVYDPAQVVMTTDFGDSLVTEAARPFQVTLTFYTGSGLPIMNNIVTPMVSQTQGASADVYNSYPTTTIDGIDYVNGLANNAVGEYDIIIDLESKARWFIPVYQGVPLPGARKHFGAM